MRHALAYTILASIPLAAFGYVASTVTTGCSSGDNSDAGPDVTDDGYDPPPTPAAWDAPVTRPDDQTAAQNRVACTYKRGDMPAATQSSATQAAAAIALPAPAATQVASTQAAATQGATTPASTLTW